MDDLLHPTVRALDGSSATVPNVKGLGHPSEPLDVHDHLAERNFADLAGSVMTAITRHKSLLEHQIQKFKASFFTRMITN